MLGREEKDVQEHQRQNVNEKGWEDLRGQDGRVGWGLEDTKGPLKTELWLKCGKNPKGSNTSTADLTSILISLADFHFARINFFPIRLALKIKCPLSLLIFVMESKSPRIKILGFRGKSILTFVFTFLLLFFRINTLLSLDSPLEVHKDQLQSSPPSLPLALPTHPCAGGQQSPPHHRDTFWMQIQSKPVPEVSGRN